MGTKEESLQDMISNPRFRPRKVFDSVESNNSNDLNNCDQIKKAKGNLAAGLSAILHLEMVGVAHPTQFGGTSGENGISREFTAHFKFSAKTLK